MSKCHSLFVLFASLLQGCMVASNGSQPSSVTTTVDSRAESPQPARSGGASSLADVGSRLEPAQALALLAEHDRVRADVGVERMSWSPDLAAYAQDWADELAGKGCLFEHRPNSRFGENLFMGTVGAYTVADAVRGWEEEKKDYDGGVLTEENWYPAGHYTQVVWRQTTALGCAAVDCGGNMTVVCNYDPPGNVLGQSPY